MKNLKEHKNIIFGFILIQIAIIAGMFVKSMHPLVLGDEMLLKVQPKDPRDIFRGDYSVLNYQFNRLNLREVSNDLDSLKKYNYGDIVYLEMEKKDRFYEAVGVWEKKPESSNRILKGIIENKYSNNLMVNCGIEQYFAKTDKAKELDSLSTWFNRKKYTVYVSAMVTKSGTVRIKEIHCDEAGF